MGGPKSRWNQVTGTATGVAKGVVKSTKALTTRTPHDALDDVREVLRKADARLSRIFERAKSTSEIADAEHPDPSPKPPGDSQGGSSGSRT